MQRALRFWSILIALGCLPSPARADITIDAPQGARTTVLNFFGQPISCMSKGIPVVFTFDYTLGDTGVADFLHTPSVIVLNPANILLFYNIDPAAALFAIGHECGHAYLLTSNESDADCYSVQLGIAQGWFTVADLPAMLTVFQNNPGDWSHPPGPVRWSHIVDCANEASGSS